MPEEDSITRTRMNYKGYFKLREFYNFLYDVCTSLGYDVIELECKQASDSFEFEWRNEKSVDDFTMFVIKIKTRITDLKEENNGKEKLNKGNVELTIQAVLRTDYNAKWEINPMLKFMKGIYERYIYKPTYDHWVEKVKEEMNEALNEIKSFFHIEKISMGAE
ncbi:MAG: hypothetical protein PHW96_03010 [Candidatus Nanoarchaeia archaeon]|nr:hypothetical protein [Candidatus Nanoarchaeia archaeon]